MADVFISYKREDRNKARLIAELLVKKGYDVWWDVELLPGDKFADEINEILSNAKAAIVLWTPQSVQSNWVKSEASIASNRGILIPICLRETNIPAPFNTLHSLDLTSWDSNQVETTLDVIVKAVEKKIGRSNLAKDIPSAQEIDSVLKSPEHEVEFWSSICNAKEPSADEYRLYIKKYGENGSFTKLAQRRIQEIEQNSNNRYLPSITKLLKLVGIVMGIAIVGFTIANILGVLDSTTIEQDKQIVELYKTGKLQQSSNDYDGAWTSFEKALSITESGGKSFNLFKKKNKDTLNLREAQEDLATDWLQNIRIPEGSTFSEIVDKVSPILSRGVSNSSGSRKADLLAHIGWGNYLRSRDGHGGLDPSQTYQQALEVDSTNPYAHVYWGHWLLWINQDINKAEQHFADAIASGRDRSYVRRMQISAFMNRSSLKTLPLLSIGYEMWANKEQIDTNLHREIYHTYYAVCFRGYREDKTREDKFKEILTLIPAEKHLAFFQAMFSDERVKDRFLEVRDACLATLLEALGQNQKALQIWKTLSEKYSSKDNKGVENVGVRAEEGVNRLSQ